MVDLVLPEPVTASDFGKCLPLWESCSLIGVLFSSELHYKKFDFGYHMYIVRSPAPTLCEVAKVCIGLGLN
jgi:hypothetical protein